MLIAKYFGTDIGPRKALPLILDSMLLMQQVHQNRFAVPHRVIPHILSVYWRSIQLKSIPTIYQYNIGCKIWYLNICKLCANYWDLVTLLLKARHELETQFCFSGTILIAISELCIINVCSNWYFNEKMGTCEDYCPVVWYIILHYNDISGFS